MATFLCMRQMRRHVTYLHLLQFLTLAAYLSFQSVSLNSALPKPGGVSQQVLPLVLPLSLPVCQISLQPLGMLCRYVKITSERRPSMPLVNSNSSLSNIAVRSGAQTQSNTNVAKGEVLHCLGLLTTYPPTPLAAVCAQVQYS